jgi:hypothetical protein
MHQSNRGTVISDVVLSEGKVLRLPPTAGRGARVAAQSKAHLNSLHTRLSLYQTTSLLFQFAILI